MEAAERWRAPGLTEEQSAARSATPTPGSAGNRVTKNPPIRMPGSIGFTPRLKRRADFSGSSFSGDGAAKFEFYDENGKLLHRSVKPEWMIRIITAQAGAPAYLLDQAR